MKKLILLLALIITLSACSTVKSVIKSSSSSNPSLGQTSKAVERVGVLLILKLEDCLLSYGCGSQISLLAQDMQTRTVALVGDIDESLNGKLIAVQGVVVEGKEAEETLRVDKALSITNVQTQQFLDENSGQYISEAFGCQVYWDRTYSWTLDERQPYLLVKLTQNIGSDAGNMIELKYDGLTGELKNVNSLPEGLNPCSA